MGLISREVGGRVCDGRGRRDNKYNKKEINMRNKCYSENTEKRDETLQCGQSTSH